MSEILFSITVEKSGFPSSCFWSTLVMLILVDAENVAGPSKGAFRIYFLVFLFLIMLQVKKKREFLETDDVTVQCHEYQCQVIV